MSVNEDLKFRTLLHAVCSRYGEFCAFFREEDRLGDAEKILEKCKESEKQLIDYVDQLVQSKSNQLEVRSGIVK